MTSPRPDRLVVTRQRAMSSHSGCSAFSLDGPVIIECVVDPHEPPMPAKVKALQVRHLIAALRDGTPNRNRIALQMVKDMRDEASFAASPGHVLTDGGSASEVLRLLGKLRDRADADQGD